MKSPYKILISGTEEFINAARMVLGHLDGVEIIKEYCKCKNSNGWYIAKGLIKCQDCNSPFDLDEIRERNKDNEFVEYLNEKKEK